MLIFCEIMESSGIRSLYFNDFMDYLQLVKNENTLKAKLNKLDNKLNKLKEIKKLNLK